MLQKIPFQQYLELDGYVNKHQLDDIHKSIRKWKWSRTVPREPTEAMIIGSATHTAVLEPHLFDEQYAVLPRGIDRRTKAGKEAYAAFEAQSGGRIVLQPSAADDIRAMSYIVRNHPVVKPLFELDHIVEGTALVEKWRGYSFGVKVRPDLYVPGAALVVDLKTTQSISRNSVMYAIRDFRYHVQAALYIDAMRDGGCSVADFLFVFVEKTAPNDVYCVRLSKESIALGRMEYIEDMDRLQDYLDNGEATWTGPLGGNEVQEVSIV